MGGEKSGTLTVAQSKPKPIRVLHIVGAMNRAGIETWLMQVLRHIDRERFRLDFLVHTVEPGEYDAEARALGSKVLLAPDPRKLLKYGREFRRILQEHGPYDILHSHMHLFSGFILRLAKKIGIPIRLVHGHNSVVQESRVLRKLYSGLMRRWLLKYATAGIAVSRQTAVGLFGAKWEQDPRWRVLYCGIDLAPFREQLIGLEPPTSGQLGGTFCSVRSELGIPPDALVLGSISRLRPEKNHLFLVDVAAAVREKLKQVSSPTPLRLLIVGEGPMQEAIEARIRERGLESHTIFAGVRQDVARVLAQAMDVFVFPSFSEGLGLALVEAQSAGVPCVMSEGIPPEADVVGALANRVLLAAGAEAWADKVLEVAGVKNPALRILRSDALAQVERSPFNILVSVDHLVQLYEGLWNR